MIKLGTQVQHKLHDALNGDVVQLNRSSNTATVKYWIDDYEPMLVSVYLSDLLEVVEDSDYRVTIDYDKLTTTFEVV